MALTTSLWQAEPRPGSKKHSSCLYFCFSWRESGIITWKKRLFTRTSLLESSPIPKRRYRLACGRPSYSRSRRWAPSDLINLWVHRWSILVRLRLRRRRRNRFTWRIPTIIILFPRGRRPGRKHQSKTHLIGRRTNPREFLAMQSAINKKVLSRKSCHQVWGILLKGSEMTQSVDYFNWPDEDPIE